MSRSDLDRLSDAKAFAQKAIDITTTWFSLYDLAEERYLATLFCLATVGEALWKTSATLRRRNPMIPWDDIYGMRNRIVHGYWKIDRHTVFLAVRHDLPELVATLDGVIRREATAL